MLLAGVKSRLFTLNRRLSPPSGGRTELHFQKGIIKREQVTARTLGSWMEVVVILRGSELTFQNCSKSLVAKITRKNYILHIYMYIVLRLPPYVHKMVVSESVSVAHVGVSCVWAWLSAGSSSQIADPWTAEGGA